MKEVLISIAISAIATYSFAQEAKDTKVNIIQVPLTVEEGGGPFGVGMTRLGNRDNPEHPYFNALPQPIALHESLIGFRELHIIPNYMQMVYESAAQGLIDEKSWQSLEARYKDQDILSDLSADPIRHYIRLASRKNDDGTFDIWVDQNANDLFEDNELYHYGMELMESPKMWQDLPIIKVSYETVNKGQVVKEDLPIRLNPFAYPTDILYNIDTHRKGKLSLNDQEIGIYVANGFTSDYFSPETLKVFAHNLSSPYEEMEHADKNFMDYGEVVFLGDVKYSISRIDKGGTFLTLEKYPDDKEWIGSQVGAKAFPIVSRTLDSLPFELYNNKITMLDFWGTWCGPCVEEIPFLKDAVAFFNDDEFELVGIALDNLPKLTEFIEKNRINWKQVLHKYGEDSVDITKLYGINAYPTTYLLDKNSKIISKNLGLRGFEIYRTLSKELGKDPQLFLDFIAQGDAVLTISNIDNKFSTAYLTGGNLGEEKLYAYKQNDEFIRGLHWPEGEDEISLEIKYMTKERKLQSHTLHLKKSDIKEGKIEVKL